jgi:hypothetical protein
MFVSNFIANLNAFGKDPISTIIIGGFVIVSIITLTAIAGLIRIYSKEYKQKHRKY